MHKYGVLVSFIMYIISLSIFIETDISKVKQDGYDRY